MTCPSATACVLIGTTATGPAIVSGTTIAEPTGADTWSSDTLPTIASGYTLTQLSAVTCWSNPSCAITAVGTNASSQPVAFLLASSAGGTTSWSSLGLPTANPALYLGDIDCVQPGTGYCSAVGCRSIGSGRAGLEHRSRPGAWTDDTANGLSGSHGHRPTDRDRQRQPCAEHLPDGHHARVDDDGSGQPARRLCFRS